MVVIYCMRSANQEIGYFAYADFTVSELNADTIKNLTIEAPVSGMLKSVKYTVSVDDLSNTAALALWVSQGQDWGEVNALNSLYLQAMYDAWTGSGQLASVDGPSVPKYIFLTSQIDGNVPDNTRYELTAVKDIRELVEAGDNINFRAYGTSLANILTTGTVTVAVEFEYEVAALAYKGQRLPRRKASGMQVAIMGVFDNDDTISQWFPPGTGRISNIRLTIAGQVAAGAFNSNDFLYFGQGLYSDDQSGNLLYQKSAQGVMLTGPALGDSADPHVAYYLTTYSRELYFVKKGEPMVIRYQNTSTSERAIILIEFDFIPDFNSGVDFWYSDIINNIADASINIFTVQVPFDMFIEKVTLNTRSNDLTIDSTQYVLAIKDIAELLSNIDVISGSLFSTTFIDNSQFSQLPSNILGVQVHGNTETIQPPAKEMEVYDYFPEGSWLAIVSTFESSGTEDLANILHFTGRSRVKSNSFGFNYFTGGLVEEVMSV